MTSVSISTAIIFVRELAMGKTMKSADTTIGIGIKN
jgi:hypothetical protein